MKNSYILNENQKDVQEELPEDNNLNDNDENVNIDNADLITDEPYEPIKITDTTGINGMYTDKEYATKHGAASYSVFFIQNGKIEYNSEYVMYQGTYKQENNKLLITYTKAYGETGEAIKLDRFTDELTIESENKLISAEGNVEFKKE